jgi:hypothetical protein
MITGYNRIHGKFEELDKFSEQNRSTIKAILDTFILKNRFQKSASVAEG